MNNKSKIRLVSHPYAFEIYQSLRDEANITGTQLIERPFWFEDIETGRLYHEIMGCIGYPSEVQDKDSGMPGYICILGIVRPDKELEYYKPVDAKFLLLDEFQSKDIGTLLNKCIELREKYGYGIQPELLKVFYGDAERFQTTVALFNDKLARKYGHENNALLITPPVDMYSPMVFDQYLRALKSCLLPGQLRLYFGENEILKNDLREFKRDCPSVFAIGGLIHSLLTHCSWMSDARSNAFAVEEK